MYVLYNGLNKIGEPEIDTHNTLILSSKVCSHVVASLVTDMYEKWVSPPSQVETPRPALYIAASVSHVNGVTLLFFGIFTTLSSVYSLPDLSTLMYLVFVILHPRIFHFLISMTVY
jgi:hypothetical protein